MKTVVFRGSSLDDLRSFPASVMREAGYQIDRIQNGLLPDDFKPMAVWAVPLQRFGFGTRWVRFG